MKVFLGSSTESKSSMRDVAEWIEEAGHEALPWDESSLFLPGDFTFSRLMELSKDVDAAVFIFSEDDRIWYHQDITSQPRDNVLIEYGLFAGALGHKRAIFCLKGRPKSASDLKGITYIDLNKRQRARNTVLYWIQSLEPQKEPVFITELRAQISLLRKGQDELKHRFDFEQKKSRDLQDLLTREGAVDFHRYDFSADAHWKLLFDYAYFWAIVSLLHRHYKSPLAWQSELERCGETHNVIVKLNWGQSKDVKRTPIYIAKSLRLLRQLPSMNYKLFLERLQLPIQKAIYTQGKTRARALQKE